MCMKKVVVVVVIVVYVTEAMVIVDIADREL